jgi:hypothetical protein
MFLWLLSVCVSHLAWAQLPCYMLVPLGNFVPLALNNAGQMAGYFSIDANTGQTDVSICHQ